MTPFYTDATCNETARNDIYLRWQLNKINLIIKALVCYLESKRERKKTSMCLSWSGAPEVLTNLWWPVYALPPLIAPCISVWCESSHCSERPVSPQRSHTFIITLYCRTLYGHSAPNSLPVKNRAFSSSLLLVVSVLITNTEPKPESSAGLAFFCSLIKARMEFIEGTLTLLSHLLLRGQDKSFSNLYAETCPGTGTGR